MAGPAVHIAYVSEDGTTYRVLVPSWVQAVTGDAALSTGPGLPKGYKRRIRYIRDSAGKIMKLTIGDPTDAAWTAAFGATVTPTPAPPTGGTGFVYQGRTGEDDKIRG